MPQLSTSMVFALSPSLESLIFLGISRARGPPAVGGLCRQAGRHGVTTAGAHPSARQRAEGEPQPIFQPAADRLGRGEKGQGFGRRAAAARGPQARASEFFMIRRDGRPAGPDRGSAIRVGLTVPQPSWLP
jgi:hypothetical protein